MKGSGHHSPQDATDLLLFEYLEGNLSGPDRKVLEQRLAKDPELQEELESWKETYVTQNFYPTKQLEERLITLNQAPRKFSVSLSLNTVVVFILTASISFMLKTDTAKNFQILSSHELSKIAFLNDAASDEEAISGKLMDRETLISDKATTNEEIAFSEMLKGEVKNPVEAEKTSMKLSSRELNNLPLLNMESRPVCLPDPNIVITKIIPETGMKPLRLVQQKTPNTISRKQQRMIERKKEKARQERKAREFMKGDVPYVVPLNFKNF